MQTLCDYYEKKPFYSLYAVRNIKSYHRALIWDTLNFSLEVGQWLGRAMLTRVVLSVVKWGNSGTNSNLKSKSSTRFHLNIFVWRVVNILLLNPKLMKDFKNRMVWVKHWWRWDFESYTRGNANWETGNQQTPWAGQSLIYRIYNSEGPTEERKKRRRKEKNIYIWRERFIMRN